MLDLLRKAVNTWIFRGLLLLIIASFAFWGMGDVYQGGGDQQGPVAEVAGNQIPPQALQSRFQREVQRMNRRFDMDLTRSEAREMGLLDQALDNLINQNLYRLAAAEAGLVASDSMVQEALRGQEIFHDNAGNFDRQRFRAVLQRAGMTESGYLDSLRGDLVSQPLLQAVRQGAHVPQALVDNIYRLRAETRDAEILALPHERISLDETPDEAALREIYENRDSAFTAPAYRDVTVLAFDATDLADEIQIGEDAIQQAWQERKDQYQEPLERQVTQTIVESQATAREIHRAARQGESSLAQAVASVTDDASAEPFELGWVTQDELPDGLGEPVFDTPVGAVGGPVETSLGWHVFQVKDSRGGADRTTLADVRDELETQLVRERGRDQLYEMSTKVEDALAGGASLEAVGERFGLPVRSVAGIAQSGEMRSGEQPDWLTDSIIETAFQLDNGETSDLNDSAEAGFFVVRVDGVQPPQKRPFSAVRDQARELWAQQRRSEIAAERADTLAQRLREGAQPSLLAERASTVDHRSVTGLRADGRNQTQVPSGLRQAIFQAESGAAVKASDDRGHYVAKVTAVTPGDPQADQEAVSQLRQQLDQQLASDLIQQLNEALRQRYDVQVYESRVENVF